MHNLKHKQLSFAYFPQKQMATTMKEKQLRAVTTKGHYWTMYKPHTKKKLKKSTTN